MTDRGSNFSAVFMSQAQGSWCPGFRQSRSQGLSSYRSSLWAKWRPREGKVWRISKHYSFHQDGDVAVSVVCRISLIRQLVSILTAIFFSAWTNTVQSSKTFTMSSLTPLGNSTKDLVELTPVFRGGENEQQKVVGVWDLKISITAAALCKLTAFALRSSKAYFKSKILQFYM